MNWKSIVVAIALVCSQTGVALADELTQIVQQDLTSMGYDTGGVSGTANTKTIIAVSRFQSEHDLEVTGEITPQLAGVIKAAMSKPVSAPAAAQLTPAQAQAELKARQEACLQEKVASAQQTAKLKSGLGKLLSAVTRSASQFGGADGAAVAGQISTTRSDVSSVDASITDLEGAAKDLGVAQSDIDACQNP